jgi:hypothetical protein
MAWGPQVHNRWMMFTILSTPPIGLAYSYRALLTRLNLVILEKKTGKLKVLGKILSSVSTTKWLT